MREIKFRAWDYHFHRWHYAILRENGEWEVEARSVKEDSLVTDKHIGEWRQYTGLKDKNGKEIYEGDIIEIVREMYMPEGPLATMRVPLNQSTLLEVLREADAVHDGEVIGNIYENPELLK